MTICKHTWVEEHYGYLCTACGLVDPCFDDYDWTEYPDDGEDDEEYFDCGWIHPTGGCSAAGSEACDFECPYRDELYRGMRLTQARLAKRSKTT